MFSLQRLETAISNTINMYGVPSVLVVRDGDYDAAREMIDGENYTVEEYLDGTASSPSIKASALALLKESDCEPNSDGTPYRIDDDDPFVLEVEISGF